MNPYLSCLMKYSWLQNIITMHVNLFKEIKSWKDFKMYDQSCAQISDPTESYFDPPLATVPDNAILNV